MPRTPLQCIISDPIGTSLIAHSSPIQHHLRKTSKTGYPDRL
jgi:hypothetical protein